MKLLKKEIFHLLIIFLSFILSILLNKKIEKENIYVSKEQSQINLNESFIRLSSMGNNRFASSILWILTLLDSDLEHYKKKDLNSWLFLRFKTISTLDPYFYENYYFGGQYLSIIKDDLIGSQYILEKGLSLYPIDFNLLWASAFLQTFELQDFKKGLYYFEKIKNHPRAPLTIISLIEKLKFYNNNDLEATFESVKLTLEITTDEMIKNKLKSDLYSIKAMIDLDCLNNRNQKKQCNLYDFYGNKYLFDGVKWSSKLNFSPYKLHLRN